MFLLIEELSSRYAVADDNPFGSYAGVTCLVTNNKPIPNIDHILQHCRLFNNKPVGCQFDDV